MKNIANPKGINAHVAGAFLPAASLSPVSTVADVCAAHAIYDAAGIDMGALRTELHPAAANDAPEAACESNGNAQEQQAADEHTKPAKGGKKKTKVISTEAWPFPTGARGA